MFFQPAYWPPTGQISAWIGGVNGTYEIRFIGYTDWGIDSTFVVPLADRDGRIIRFEGRSSTGQLAEGSIQATPPPPPPSPVQSQTAPVAPPPDPVAPAPVAPAPVIVPTAVAPAPSPSASASFAMITQAGLWDGQHIANYGADYAIYARVVVVDGRRVLYAVGKELAPGKQFYGMMVKLGQPLLRMVFADSVVAEYATQFADLPQYEVDTSVPASAFHAASTQGNYRAYPTAVPIVSGPSVPAQTLIGGLPMFIGPRPGPATLALPTESPVPEAAAPSPNYALDSGTAPKPVPAGLKTANWKPYVFGALGMLVLVGLGLFLKKKFNKS